METISLYRRDSLLFSGLLFHFFSISFSLLLCFHLLLLPSFSLLSVAFAAGGCACATFAICTVIWHST